MKCPCRAVQLGIGVRSSEETFGLETNMEVISPPIVNEVWEKITLARTLM